MQRKPKTTGFWSWKLPHWEVEDGRYFITIHLAGAIPAAGRRRIQVLASQLQAIPDRDSPEWLQQQRAIFAEMENWLDRAQWNPLLQQQEIAAMVVEAVEHRVARGNWNMLQYVIMPTHIHLFCEFGDQEMKPILEDFKRWTGHQATKMLRHTARFWQHDWFDHWSRSDEEDDRIIRYIQNNPVKASLVQDYRDWPYGSWRK